MGARAMDVGMCSRHSGAQPGGSICATCLQEKLILLWRGEGNSNWDTEEFSVTPPLERLASSKSPPVDEPSPAEDHALRYATAPTAHEYRGVAAPACFPVLFRVRHHLRRDDVHEPSKEREKIDRSSRVAAVDDGASDREREFSCELKSIMKELSALHEKKKKSSKPEKAVVKVRSGGTESGCFSGRRPQHEEVAADVIQRGATSAPQSGTEDATAVLAPPAEIATTSYHDVPKARAASDDADAKSLQCFSVLWPALVNMKWARALVSPIMSSNKIAPSKSDLLAKMVNGGAPGREAAVAAGESEARAESGRNCETSGEDYEFERGRGHLGDPGAAAAGMVAVLPPRWVQPVADEDGSVLEIDKETRLRMEASRITVMTWLESLPSPKAAHLPEPTHKDAIPDDLSLGNGVLEMCDEEEEVFDIQSQEETAMAADNIKHETTFVEAANDPVSEPQASATTSFDFTNDPTSEPPQASATTSFEFANDPPSEPPQASSAADIYARMSSFGKFLRTSSEQIHAPTRIVDIEIAAQ